MFDPERMGIEQYPNIVAHIFYRTQSGAFLDGDGRGYWEKRPSTIHYVGDGVSHAPPEIYHG